MPERAGLLARLRARFAGRSLGGKLVLILTAVGLVGSAAITLLLVAIITPSFNTLEREAVGGHVERTRAALAEYASQVESTARDYGDWNDSYAYMVAPSRQFEEESFSTLAMQNLGVQGMAYVARDGTVRIARWIDGERDAPAMRAGLLDAIRATDLRAVTGKSNSASFYARIGDTLTAVAVAQVRRSDGTGDPRGHVVMVRTLGPAQLAGLLQIDARVGPAIDGDDAVIDAERARIDIAVPIAGADGRAVATAAFTVPRDLSLLGTRMLVYAVAATVLLLLLVLLSLRRMIARLVLAPLARVERHMQRVRASGEPALVTDAPRADEIGSLITSLNAMMRQLKDAREQLEVQSFKLGRNESAVAVMHNVRNALNPISTILSQGLAARPGADRAMLDRALGELADADIPPARRQKLAAFVLAAIEADGEDRSERRRQIEIGREALANVLDIIGRQQAEAHERPPLAPCNLSDIVAQNATIARYSGGSSIAFSFPSRPHWALANRVLLSQVVGNLFANAAEAIAANGTGGGTIAVEIRDEADRVELLIRDDGEGFDPDATATLFQRGFSTRAHKSGGLGLHWCANSLVAMEGTLRLVSEGQGMGAVAIVTLRAASAKELEATGLAA